MNLMMPSMLAWVLGGNEGALRNQDRSPHCRVGDKPKAFDEKVGTSSVLSACITHRKCQRFADDSTLLGQILHGVEE
jgi:hypothetical protein